MNTFYYLDDTQFDQDRHGNCDCGLCNGNGKSYRVSLYEMNAEGIQLYLLLEAGIDEESFEAWLQEQEPIDVVYAPSEESAVSEAFMEAKRNQYLLLGVDRFLPTEQGPLWFLTNGMCESTSYWTPAQFDRFGLSYASETLYGPYPLLPEEARFIGEDGFTAHYDGLLRLGYSVLWQNKKWLCPTIEYILKDWNDITEYERFIEEKERWQKIIAPLGGTTVEDYSCSDRYILLLVVPFEEVTKQFSHFYSWKDFLKDQDERN